MLKNRTKFRFLLQNCQLRPSAVWPFHAPKVVGVHKDLVPSLCPAAVLLVILRFDGRFAVRDSPQVPREHDAHSKAEDDSKDIHHGKHYFWRVVRPGNDVRPNAQRFQDLAVARDAEAEGRNDEVRPAARLLTYVRRALVHSHEHYKVPLVVKADALINPCLSISFCSRRVAAAPTLTTR